ncbi:hypothetical protein Drorol1_Dr00014181 [Drosera rotundifolia]
MHRLIFSLATAKNPTRNFPHLLFSTIAARTSTFSSTSNLYTQICLIGSPNASLVPILDGWIEAGNRVRADEVQNIIRALRARKRFKQALQVSEWMSSKRICPVYTGDRARHLDLIGKVHGLQAAESYFLQVNEKSEKIYGALLNCYVREGLIEKSLSHFKRMKEMGFASALSYNNIMSLYLHAGQPEKIPQVMSEMKSNRVVPHNFTYRICLQSYGMRSDFSAMERLLNDLEQQLLIPIHWSVYVTAASIYLKPGLKEKALLCMRKAERLLKRDATGYNNLITLYASLGDKTEMLRLWGVKKTIPAKTINNDYMTMMGSLVKLDALEDAEKLFEDWESAANTSYDFRVPNIVLKGYTKRGLVREAEAFLEKIIEKGRRPVPNSWEIIAAGYVNQGEMEKALQCMNKAFALLREHDGRSLNPRAVTGILDWLSENGDVERLESFIESLRRIIPVDREMYHALIKANIRKGRDVNGVLQDMKANNIDEDDDTRTIMCSPEETRKIMCSTEETMSIMSSPEETMNIMSSTEETAKIMSSAEETRKIMNSSEEF